MKRSVLIALVAFAFVAAILVLVATKPLAVQASASSVSSNAAQDSGSSAVWDSSGQLQRPVSEHDAMLREMEQLGRHPSDRRSSSAAIRRTSWSVLHALK